jgi:endogenous inhibitor of DNA gyrase (YacG/DUF329 family)
VKPTRPCPRCGKLDTVEAWPSSIFRGFVAGCRPCYDDDVDAWALGGAASIVFAPTARLAIEKWNAPGAVDAREPA